jgi:hypothetical protein
VFAENPKVLLAKKLGIKPGLIIRLINQPDYYPDLFPEGLSDVVILDDKTTKKDLIHYFATGIKQLEVDIIQLLEEIQQNGMIWISWPKKSSNINTDLTENMIRDIALNNGLVDVKVCSVDDIWSALKLVIRLKDRK